MKDKDNEFEQRQKQQAQNLNQETTGNLNIDKMTKWLKAFQDDYYIQMQKVAESEVSHAHTTHQKQITLQIEKEKRAKIVT